MSIIDRAADAAEITLDRDVPVVGQRRCRDWSRLIGLARKLESQETQAEKEQHRRYEDVLEENRKLLARVHVLERELEQLRLCERMRHMELSRKDQQFLLEGAKEEVA